jgi:hypothetical protein
MVAFYVVSTVLCIDVLGVIYAMMLVGWNPPSLAIQIPLIIEFGLWSKYALGCFKYVIRYSLGYALDWALQVLSQS